jgi:hypothetical protein
MLKFLIIQFLPFFECSAHELSSEVVNPTTSDLSSLNTFTSPGVENISVTSSISSVFTFFDNVFKTFLSYVSISFSPNTNSTTQFEAENAAIIAEVKTLSSEIQNAESTEKALQVANSAADVLIKSETQVGKILDMKGDASEILVEITELTNQLQALEAVKLGFEFSQSRRLPAELKLFGKNVLLVRPSFSFPSPLPPTSTMRFCPTLGKAVETSCAKLADTIFSQTKPRATLRDKICLYSLFEHNYFLLSQQDLKVSNAFFQTACQLRASSSIINSLDRKIYESLTSTDISRYEPSVITAFNLQNLALMFERLTWLTNLRTACNFWGDDRVYFYRFLIGHLIHFPIETNNDGLINFVPQGIFITETLYDLHARLEVALTNNTTANINTILQESYQNDLRMYELNISRRSDFKLAKYQEFMQNSVTPLQLIIENSQITNYFSDSMIDYVHIFNDDQSNLSIEQRTLTFKALIEADIRKSFSKITDVEMNYVSDQVLRACKIYK